MPKKKSTEVMTSQETMSPTEKVKAKSRCPFSISEKSKPRGQNTKQFIYTIDDPSRGSTTKAYSTKQEALDAFSADIKKLEDRGIQYRECTGRYAKFIKCVTTEKGVLYIVQEIEDALDLNGKRIWYIELEVKEYKHLRTIPCGRVYFANKKETRDAFKALIAKYEAVGWETTTYREAPNFVSFTYSGASYYCNLYYGSAVIGANTDELPVQRPEEGAFKALVN